MASQFELFKKVKPEKEFPRQKWDKRETFWISRVKHTEKEHICNRCGGIMPEGSRAEITVDLEGGRPDFKTAKYWHPNGKCQGF